MHLDPGIEAEMRAMEARRELERILHPPDLLSAIRDVRLDLPPPPNPALTATPPREEEPLVPAGSGPATPREGETGDVVEAIMAVPSVDRALTRLRTTALDRVSSDWRRLRPGEQAAVVTVTALIAGSALTGALAKDDSRRFLLDRLDGRDLGVPGVDGLSVRFNTRPDNVGVMITYDLGPLLSRKLGL